MGDTSDALEVTQLSFGDAIVVPVFSSMVEGPFVNSVGCYQRHLPGLGVQSLLFIRCQSLLKFIGRFCNHQIALPRSRANACRLPFPAT
jgi:hypothetical protein